MVGKGKTLAVIFLAEKNVRNPERLGLAIGQRQTPKFAMIWYLIAADIPRHMI